MRRLKWVLAIGVMWSLACALGSDEPVDVEPEPVPEVKPVAEKTAPGARDRRAAGKAGGKTRSGEAAEPTEAPKTTSGAGQAPAGIQSLGNNKWSVKRSLVRKWEDQPRKFAKVSEKGKGWALKGVDTRDARHLGFENGDVILSVNGHPLATEAQAATAYGLVRNKKQIVVKFKRAGNKRSTTIQIKD